MVCQISASNGSIKEPTGRKPPQEFARSCWVRRGGDIFLQFAHVWLVVRYEFSYLVLPFVSDGIPDEQEFQLGAYNEENVSRLLYSLALLPLTAQEG
jgi:hypothetical protein